jgi:chromosome partitioning protein
MARTTVIANQKGGVGKTTTADALSAGLRQKGFRVLSIDADPQCNLTHTMRADTSGKGLFDLLNGEPIDGLIQETEAGHILSCTRKLAGADKQFPDYDAAFLLKNGLAPLKDKFSHIIIDSPPALGILTINCLIAADDVICPLTADMYGIMGMGELHSTIRRVQQNGNTSLKIAGLLLTRYKDRTILSRDLKNSIEEKAREMQTILYGASIRESIQLREAQAMRQTIFEYAPKSNGALDYAELTAEYLSQQGGI